MAPTEVIVCVAVDVCSGRQISVLLAQQIGGCDPQAIAQIAQQQSQILGQLDNVQKSLSDSTKKLQAVWTLGTSTASMASTLGQLDGCFGALISQGTSAAQQIQAAATLLQDVTRIVQFVKAANAACAALMCNPFTAGAARALGTATAVQVTAWMSVVAQVLSAIGQVLSAVQQSTQSTNGTTTTVAELLAPAATTTTTPTTTTPTTTTTATYPSYPTYPTYPTVTANPATTYPAASGTTAADPMASGPLAAPTYAQQTAVPTVYSSGLVAQNPGGAAGSGTAAGGTVAGSAGTGDHLTINITENSDGKYNLTVDVPDDQLDKDLKINVDANVGGQGIKGNINIDR
ncbi:hypothetical protein [Rugosimonospora africana]|uniref:Uncharacterized protein n=1 Tax=Rugosimonospora africana TaxID=556532 RepID=A0A8J3R475_9ACTN|nr:hypothetical protein [Rugosimonospora africana]GIH21035.1 hypothetical protein Raf01_92070 [Rugosimonospora africana]